MEKFADETMSERAHVGSAAWVEAPTFLGAFAQGNFGDHSQVVIEEEVRSGGSYRRVNPASVND